MAACRRWVLMLGNSRTDAIVRGCVAINLSNGLVQVVNIPALLFTLLCWQKENLLLYTFVSRRINTTLTIAAIDSSRRTTFNRKASNIGHVRGIAGHLANSKARAGKSRQTSAYYLK